MATIEDLDIPSITDMSADEAIEHLRQLRLSRRVQKKKFKESTNKTQTKLASKITKNQAADLLALLSEK